MRKNVDFEKVRTVIASDQNIDFIKLIRDILHESRSVDQKDVEKENFEKNIKSMKRICKKLLESSKYTSDQVLILSKINSFIGLAYLITKKSKKAETYLNQAVALNPNNFIAIELMILMHLLIKNNNKYDELKKLIYNCESGDGEFYTNVALFFAEPLLVYNPDKKTYSLKENPNNLSDKDKKSLEIYLMIALALNPEEAAFLKAAFEFAVGNEESAKSLFKEAINLKSASSKTNACININSSILKLLINESKLPILIENESQNNESLGNGSYGVIRRGKANINGKETSVAIKTNKEQEFKEDIETLLNEIEVWEKVSQYPEYFAPLLAIGLSLKSNSLFSFYMPIYELSSLDKFVNKEAEKSNNMLTEETKAEWMLSLGQALDILHKEFKLAHADLKQANILVELVDGKLKVRLADFGETSKLNEIQDSAKGTPDYQSPEFLNTDSKDRWKTTDKNDIWALGLVFLFILTNGKQSGWEKERKNDPNKRAYQIQDDLIKQGKKGVEVEIAIPEKQIIFYNRAKKIIKSCLLFEPEERSSTEKIIEEAKKLKKDYQSP